MSIRFSLATAFAFARPAIQIGSVFGILVILVKDQNRCQVPAKLCPEVNIEAFHMLFSLSAISQHGEHS
jgi:hypothetical protein